MAEDHDGDQRCDFPPDFNLEEAECCGERCAKGDHDRQADESHHAGLAVGKFAPSPTDEDRSAIKKDDCSKDGGDKLRAGKNGRCVPKPVLDIHRPEDYGNCKTEAKPKLVAKHSDGMSGVTVVASVRL